MKIRGRRATSGWPRVNCCVDGCERGTTRIQPSEGWIATAAANDVPYLCPVHWRRVPKWMKARLRRLEKAYLRWRAINRQESTRQSYLKAGQAKRLTERHWKRMVGLFDVGHIDMDEIARIIGP